MAKPTAEAVGYFLSPLRGFLVSLFFGEQNQVGDFVGEVVEFGVGAIGEEDDGEILFRETGDAGAEADGVATVADFLEAAIVVDEPAEAVAASRPVADDVRRESHAEDAFADELGFVEGLVPL